MRRGRTVGMSARGEALWCHCVEESGFGIEKNRSLRGKDLKEMDVRDDENEKGRDANGL